MQPYFVPYIGYWQLMNAVDKYVVYDDVNFIKGGWINRNRILLGNEAKYFNIPIIGASSNKKINEIEVNLNPSLLNKNKRMIENAYRKAPYYNIAFQLIESILDYKEPNLALFNLHSFEIIGEFLDISTEFILSSSLNKDTNLKGENKVLSICNLLGADEYYNAVGGQELYSFKNFQDQGIKLKFLDSNEISYPQFENDFVGHLSIIDCLMFNSQGDVKTMLNQFSIIKKEAK